MLSSIDETLHLEHVLGLRGDVRGGVHLLSDDSAIYPCGNRLVIWHRGSKSQKFITGTHHRYEISAVAMNPTRRLIAVAEDGHDSLVNIYDAGTLRRKKVLRIDQDGTTGTIHVSFSRDSKLCLVLGGEPHFNLTLWSIEKAAKVVSSFKLATPSGKEMYKADISPADSSVVSVTGNGVLRFFRLVENAFRPVTVNLKSKPDNYISQCWLPGGQLVLGTLDGDLVVIENFAVRAVVTSQSKDWPIHSMIPFAKGIVAGSDVGLLRVYYHLENGRDFFNLAGQFTIHCDHSRITNLTLSPSDNVLALATSNGNMFSFPISSLDMLDQDGLHFEHFVTPFHGPGESGSSEITCVDSCVSRPIIATGGSDGTVQIWNYEEKKTEVVQQYDCKVLTVSLHPCGRSILVVTTDKLHLCSILSNRIRTSWEFGAQKFGLCRFSNGGQYFAVSRSGACVHVYNTYTCELLCTLQGHSAEICNVCWKKDDRAICTIGADGVVAFWSVPGWKKVTRHVDPLSSYIFGDVTHDFAHVYILTADGIIKKLSLSGDALSVDSEITIGREVNQICVASHVNLFFIAGSEALKPGTISAIVLSAPTRDSQQQTGELQCHWKPITSMCMSHKQQMLFTASEDGSLCVFRIRPKIQVESARHDSEIMQLCMPEEILVSTSELKEKADKIDALRRKIEETKLNNDAKIKALDDRHKKELSSIKDGIRARISESRQGHNEMIAKQKKKLEEYNRTIQSLHERQCEEISATRSSNAVKLSAEMQRLEELTTQREEGSRKWDKENNDLVNKHTSFLQDLSNEYSDKTRKEFRLHMVLEKTKKEMIDKYKRSHELIEEDADLEIATENEKYGGKLSEEIHQLLLLKEENGILKKKHDALQKDLDEQIETIKVLNEKGSEIEGVISDLERTVQLNKKDLQEQDEIISRKNEEIDAYEEKNSALEKFKFVLSDEIKGLRQRMEPREREIAELQVQRDEKDFELEQALKTNSSLRQVLRELRLKLRALQKEISEQDQSIEEKEDFISQFEGKLHDLASSVRDHKALKSKLLPLFRSYLEKPIDRAEGSGALLEYTSEERELEHMKKEVEKSKSVIQKQHRMHSSDLSKLERENNALMNHLNDLRREEKQIHLHRERVAQFGGHETKTRHVGNVSVSKEIEQQNATIAALEFRVLELQQELDRLP